MRRAKIPSKTSRKEEQVFKASGPVIVKKPKEDFLEEISDRKDNIEERLETIEDEKEELKEKAKETQRQMKQKAEKNETETKRSASCTADLPGPSDSRFYKVE